MIVEIMIIKSHDFLIQGLLNERFVEGECCKYEVVEHKIVKSILSVRGFAFGTIANILPSDACLCP